MRELQISCHGNMLQMFTGEDQAEKIAGGAAIDG
jgi:hypothetical protein